MKAAIIENGIVTNVIVIKDASDADSFSAVECPDHVQVGWKFDGEIYTDNRVPPGPADSPLEPWQFKALVIFLGKDAKIRAAIAQIPDAMQRAAALSRYDNSPQYRYSDPLVQQIRPVIGMPEQELSDA
uniref:hypothetical protein n=1 Tax=uncultured Maritalea sp. TaxID=757249 RepID=UPI002622D301